MLIKSSVSLTPKNAYAVLLAGGGGTRLWPKSRKKYPKHFLKLYGNQSLLRLAYNNFRQWFPKDRLLVITHQDYVEETQRQLPEMPRENIIAEPEAKNTALAMATAAAVIHKRNPEAIVIYEAADHIYQDVKPLHKTVLAALETATKGDYLVAIGIKPTFAHTGLGYIRIGEQIGRIRVEGRDIYAFKSKGFKEKPDLVTAQSFIASGQYLWNANLYCWTTQAIFNAFKEHDPKIYRAINEVLKSVGTKDQKKVFEKVYSKADNDPIDIAVSEKAKNLLLIPGNFDWSDIGDWKVVYDISEKDNRGNVVNNPDKADYIDIGSKNTLVETNGRLIVTIGLEDVVVIDTEDALLVCAKDKTQDVKKAVEKLKADKKNKYL